MEISHICPTRTAHPTGCLGNLRKAIPSALRAIQTIARDFTSYTPSAKYLGDNPGFYQLASYRFEGTYTFQR